ncbi:pyridoxal phosphate-dependent aminotransferase [Chloroflexota bacterium]
MSISDRVKKSMEQGSWVRRMFEEGTALKKQYGPDKVFDLTLGNPVMEPPAEFNREMKKMADNPLPGMHRYMENAGYEATRAAVAEYLSKESGISFKAGDIIMTVGAAGAINVVLKTVLNPGEEVIVFAPYFQEFLNYIENHNGTPRIVPTDDRFVPRLDALEAAINDRTRVVLLNSPNNPTGAVYSQDFLRQLGEILERKAGELGRQIYLINDEAYRKLVYDGQKCPQVWGHYRQSITVTSHSKDLALPGERIGYIAVHPDLDQRKELIDGLIHCNRILGFVNAPALMQHLVSHLQNATVSIADYQKKRDLLYDNLTDMGYQMVKPRGAFYLFPKTPIEDDIAFVRELQKKMVLTVPGSGFGTPGYIRISYCTDDRTLEGALPAFREAARQYKLK